MSEDGISLRMIREYRPEEDRVLTTVDRVLLSCVVLGHTWGFNVGEPYCRVCGMPNPAVSRLHSDPPDRQDRGT